MKTLHLPISYKFGSLKKPNTSLNLNSKKVDWIFKRIILHIIWGVLNVLGLIYISALITGTGWEVVFLIGGLVYFSAYWIITCIIFDKLIGDEIDNMTK